MLYIKKLKLFFKIILFSGLIFVVPSAYSNSIQDIAIEDGMITLREYGKQLIYKQLTTISELERVCKI